MGKENYDQKPLYDDGQIRIDFHPTSADDHVLYIKERKGITERKDDETQYILQRGVLAELARTLRGDLWQKIDTINPMLPPHIKKEGIGIDGLHVALCQAYIEQERRYSESR